ncbi:uncharacterized protein EURHEDRAFT_415091, partial [Aspergillus ruber CBS 135680]
MKAPHPKECTVHLAIHSQDWNTFTLLFQGDYGGLGVEDVFKPGTFIPATSIKDGVVVDAGDVLQMWSNSTYHVLSGLYQELLGL